MADLCLKCYNKLHETEYKPEDVWLKYRLCDRCGQWKMCVYDLSPSPYLIKARELVAEINAERNKE